jgi:hypothetical protein
MSEEQAVAEAKRQLADLESEEAEAARAEPGSRMVTEPRRAEALIQLIRGQRVILDSSLAGLYGVTTARLNEQVRRNADRFPPDFMFRLTRQGITGLISQNATSKTAHGGRRKLPMVFTEHGTIMAANVLNSRRAIQMSVYVVRALVRLRQVMVTNAEVARKLEELEGRVSGHDQAIRSLVRTIRELMRPPESPRRSIGFRVVEARVPYRMRRFRGATR